MSIVALLRPTAVLILAATTQPASASMPHPVDALPQMTRMELDVLRQLRTAAASAGAAALKP
jgi:hypothetical protein